ncbi:MAG: UDP-N-acetylmuramoyl-L-alanyl-D-glutamate--2,6-diaminopimelate ligase [Candidatus Aminicenantales bacterium]
MKIMEILEGIPCIQITGNREEDIRGITHVSGSVGPGFLFAALKGEKHDGNAFVPEAVASGATAILSENPPPSGFDRCWVQVQDARKSLALCSANFYTHPSRRMVVVGITGTKGKTTITYLLEKILQKAGKRPGVIGTISYRGPGWNLSAERTTPEAPDLQRMMKEMHDQGVTHCIMEVSSHALDLERVAGVDFDIAVFTNLSGEHLDYHPSMEAYFAAKKKLFVDPEKRRVGIINADDPWGQRLVSETAILKMTYGFGEGADVRARTFSLREDGTQAIIQHPEGEFEVISPLLGRPNLYNILAATACAFRMSLAEDAIRKGIAALQGVPGRFEKVPNSLGLHILVDYAHNDDALRHLLETVREFRPPRTILVFGAGGDRDRSKRPRMGEAAGELADYAIITSDNPRSEDPMAIISEIEAGIKKSARAKYEIIPDRREAIRRALELGRPGDYILVAGKGHEGTQIIQDKVLPFNDAEVIRELLEKRDRA